MEQSAALFASINLLIMGLSHCFQPKAWKEFFALLHAQGKAGAFAGGLLSLLMGSIIVAFHNVWSGVPMILTLVGWAFLVKALGVFMWPDWGVRSLAQVQSASPVKFLVAGGMLIVIAMTILVCIFMGCYTETH